MPIWIFSRMNDLVKRSRPDQPLTILEPQNQKTLYLLGPLGPLGPFDRRLKGSKIVKRSVG